MDLEAAESAECGDAVAPRVDDNTPAAAPGHVPGAETALPDYLVRHYSWAYLRPLAVWFFDRRPVINAILLGNYRRIMDCTLRLMRPDDAGSTLQIAAAYGDLTPTLASHIDDLHLVDVAPIQLELTAQKLESARLDARLALMNAEHLCYEDDRFDTAMMFLLLHELPPDARRRSVRQAMRVLRPGGRFVVADFGEVRHRHPLHRFTPFRRVLTRADPFLEGFWDESLDELVDECGQAQGKRVEREEHVDIFGGFYRVVSYCVA